MTEQVARNWSAVDGWTVQTWRQTMVYPYSTDTYEQYTLDRPADGPSQENMHAEGPAELVTLKLVGDRDYIFRDGDNVFVSVELPHPASTDGVRTVNRTMSLSEAVERGHLRVMES